MRRSKIAREFLAQNGIILERVHTSLELSNFAAGTGSKRYSLPFHVIRMRRLTGDSKQTIDWCLNLEQARESVSRCMDAHRASRDETENMKKWSSKPCQDETEWTYYIRDIRNGKIY
jgi:hypothetical protein